MKFRETFRPYAPAVLSEHVQDYFEFSQESPFMLMVAAVKKKMRGKIPAITHVDGTARLQTVTRGDNPIFYDLISAFYQLTGIPMLLNTSFNIKGAPIVETPADALFCLLNSPIDYLVMGPFILNNELYSDQELRLHRPSRKIKIERDDVTPPTFYVPALNGFKVTVLTPIEQKILDLCDEKRSIEEMSRFLNIPFHKICNQIRVFLRRQWISL